MYSQGNKDTHYGHKDRFMDMYLIRQTPPLITKARLSANSHSADTVNSTLWLITFLTNLLQSEEATEMLICIKSIALE